MIANFKIKSLLDEPTISTMINDYTAGKKEIKVTIGVLSAGETTYKVFGMNSDELNSVEYDYEIGSISKTFTTSILCKAITENRIKLDDPISTYLPLPSGNFYPTILSLATHTSGYGEYPFDVSTLSEKELETISQNLYEKRVNIYQGINRTDILNNIKGHIIKDETYSWEYSNFSIAVLGTVLGEVYDSPFSTLATEFIKNDLGLTKTRLGNGTGNLNNYWSWNEDDAYIATGGIISTVTDLLKYGQLHLKNSPEYLSLSHETYINFENEGLSMGLGWIIAPDTGYLWHNGGTSSYTSFIGIDKEHQNVVIVLSNYPEGTDSKDQGALDVLGFTLLYALQRGESGCW